MEVRKIEEASIDCGVPREKIIRYIQESWIVPVNPIDSFFDEEDVARIRLIWELDTVFGVNDDAMPIILNLIDQLNRIHLEFAKFRIH